MNRLLLLGVILLAFIVCNRQNNDLDVRRDRMRELVLLGSGAYQVWVASPGTHDQFGTEADKMLQALSKMNDFAIHESLAKFHLINYARTDGIFTRLQIERFSAETVPRLESVTVQYDIDDVVSSDDYSVTKLENR